MASVKYHHQRASVGLRVSQKFSSPCKNARGQIVPMRNLTAA